MGVGKQSRPVRFESLGFVEHGGTSGRPPGVDGPHRGDELDARNVTPFLDDSIGCR